MISATNPFPRHKIQTLDGHMSYLDEGEGDPIIFLHGNPTSSYYLWRNAIPHVQGLGRCLAPDLIGMEDSSKIEGSTYQFADHAKYLDSWFEELGLIGKITIGIQPWGSIEPLDFLRALRPLFIWRVRLNL